MLVVMLAEAPCGYVCWSDSEIGWLKQHVCLVCTSRSLSSRSACKGEPLDSVQAQRGHVFGLLSTSPVFDRGAAAIVFSKYLGAAECLVMTH